MGGLEDPALLDRPPPSGALVRQRDGPLGRRERGLGRPGDHALRRGEDAGHDLGAQLPGGAGDAAAHGAAGGRGAPQRLVVRGLQRLLRELRAPQVRPAGPTGGVTPKAGAERPKKGRTQGQDVVRNAAKQAGIFDCGAQLGLQTCRKLMIPLRISFLRSSSAESPPRTARWRTSAVPSRRFLNVGGFSYYVFYICLAPL